MSAFDEVEAETLGDIDALSREAHIIHEELVLPGWGSPDRHGYPRTLYGMVMNAMALVDRLSCYYAGRADGYQTARMRGLIERLGAFGEAAEVAVQLWRHTLMHTGSPAVVTNAGTGIAYRWLLHWGGHLSRGQHLTFQAVSADERILNMAAIYLIEDLEGLANELFRAWRQDALQRERIAKIHQDIADRQRF